MSEFSASQAPEIVGLFSDRERFQKAVTALRRAGFDRTDLSVLSSHDSIDVAGAPATPWKEALTALVGELKFEGPLIASGAIYLVGGPVAATIAAIVGAAVGGLAVKEVLDEVTSSADTEDFARAVEAGSVILWVRADTDQADTAARTLLAENGATNIHRHDPA